MTEWSFKSSGRTLSGLRWVIRKFKKKFEQFCYKIQNVQKMQERIDSEIRWSTFSINWIWLGRRSRMIDLSLTMGNIKGIASGLSIKRFHPRLAGLCTIRIDTSISVYRYTRARACIYIYVFMCVYLHTRVHPKYRVYAYAFVYIRRSLLVSRQSIAKRNSNSLI